MKLLKQILIFLVFTGVIYGIFTVVTRQKEVVNTAALSAGNHEQLIADIDRDWNGLSDWDEDIYNRHNTMVAQSLNAGIINDLDNRTLRDRINKAAYQKCVAAMNREFDRPGCDDAKLALNYGGLQTVMMNERGLANNSQIVEVSKIYSLYQRILSFNKKSLGMSPKFNGNSDSWNSWTGHQDRINRQKSEFINDPIFQNRLKKITAIAQIYKTDDRLQEARSKFYKTLGDEICAYYDRQLSQQPVASTDGDDSETRAYRAALASRVGNIRVSVANEKYLYPGHDIFNRLRSLNQRISSK